MTARQKYAAIRRQKLGNVRKPRKPIDAAKYMDIAPGWEAFDIDWTRPIKDQVD